MKDILTSQFAIGFYTCGVLLLIALYHHLKLKLAHARYKGMLSDKLEIEAATLSKLKQEADVLKKENENLRVKVQGLSMQPDNKLDRELEIYARAEKKMTVAAPGFAAPWEQAKQAAHDEIGAEEAGTSAPRKFFQRFFGGAVTTAVSPVQTVKSLPQSAEPKAENPGAV